MKLSERIIALIDGAEEEVLDRANKVIKRELMKIQCDLSATASKYHLGVKAGHKMAMKDMWMALDWAFAELKGEE